MPTVSEELTKCQARLHDSGTLWPQAELLRWYNEGYRQLLSKSGCVVRMYVHDVPGRFSYSGTADWEDQHTSSGLFQRFSRPAALGNGKVGTFLWEIEHLEGITPTASDDAITQLWERTYSDDIEQHFRFALAVNHEQIRRVAWDDIALIGTHVDNLDLLDSRWWREEGRPLYWLKGVGREGSIEVFEVVTSYNQQYDLTDYERGTAREFTSSVTTRTYGVDTVQREFDWAYTTSGDGDYLANPDDTVVRHAVRFTKKKTLSTDAECTQAWEVSTIDDATNGTTVTGDSTPTGEIIPTFWWEATGEEDNVFSVTGDTTVISALDPGLGVPRYITSPDRQYFTMLNEAGYEQAGGIPRDYRASADSLMIWEAIVPSRDLTTADTPGLIPSQMFKYLRYYTLYKAFGHSGEGQRQDLSQHYLNRFELGVQFMARLKDVSYRDKVWARKDISPLHAPTPPRVRLPSEYPRVW